MLDAHGAVSAQVAVAMAEGARRRLGADLAVAVTGVAGPDGGSAAKPVGLTYVAVADASRRRGPALRVGRRPSGNKRPSAAAALSGSLARAARGRRRLARDASTPAATRRPGVWRPRRAATPGPSGPAQRIHVIGAAGAGASAAALLAHHAGAVVTGCDAGGPSPYTPALDARRDRAAWPAHDPAHVTDAPRPRIGWP